MQAEHCDVRSIRQQQYYIPIWIRRKEKICIDYLCDKCRYQMDNIDGWKCACDAFSDGIPNERLFYATVEDSTEFNNGIEYEEKAEHPLKELKNKVTIG